MNLKDFNFPVAERQVFTSEGVSTVIDPRDKNAFLSGDYRTIVREDTNELISIVRQSCRIVPDQILIDQLLADAEYHR